MWRTLPASVTVNAYKKNKYLNLTKCECLSKFKHLIQTIIFGNLYVCG